MKRCVEDGIDSYGQLQHRFLVGFMPLQCFNITRREIMELSLILCLTMAVVVVIEAVA